MIIIIIFRAVFLFNLYFATMVAVAIRPGPPIHFRRTLTLINFSMYVLLFTIVIRIALNSNWIRCHFYMKVICMSRLLNNQLFRLHM